MKHLRLFEDFAEVNPAETLDPPAQMKKYRKSPLAPSVREEIESFMKSKGLVTSSNYDPLGKGEDFETLSGDTRENPYVTDLVNKMDMAWRSPEREEVTIQTKDGKSLLTLTMLGIISIPLGKSASTGKVQKMTKFWGEKGYPFKVIKASEGEPEVIIGYDPTVANTPEGKKKLMEDMVSYLTTKFTWWSF